jgi:hypothetical protein
MSMDLTATQVALTLKAAAAAADLMDACFDAGQVDAYREAHKAASVLAHRLVALTGKSLFDVQSDIHDAQSEEVGA